MWRELIALALLLSFGALCLIPASMAAEQTYLGVIAPMIKPPVHTPHPEYEG